MISIKDIDKYLTSVAPKELSEEWDNDGVMICGNMQKEVKKVLVALDCTMDVIEYAKNNAFDLVVSHHPFIFKKLGRIVDFDYKKLETLVKNGISVLSYHTRLDCAKNGVNDALAKTLSLENVSGFGGERGDFGRIGTLEKEMTGKEFALYLKERLGCDVRYSRCNDKKIKKVAVLGGAGKDFVFDALFSGVDAYVTSEISHNYFIDANLYDFALFDCGHYYTENCVCENLKEMLEKQFSGLCVEIFDTKSPYINC